MLVNQQKSYFAKHGHAIYISLINLCVSFFSDKNLAVEGKAFQNNLYRWHKNKMPLTIDGNYGRTYYDRSCPGSYTKNSLWFRVEFRRLVEVYAVKYFRGKFEIYSKDTDVNVNKEYN